MKKIKTQILTVIIICLLAITAYAGPALIDRTESPHVVGPSDWFQIPESTTAKGDEFIIQDRTGNAKMEIIWDGNTTASYGLAVLPGRSLGIRCNVSPATGVHVRVSADSTTNAAQVDFVLMNASFF